MAEAYGVWGEKTMYGKKYMGIIRSAFLIDEKGKIAGGLVQGQPQGHGDEPAQGHWRLLSPATTPPGGRARPGGRPTARRQ